jgi:hypothetical protein
MYQFDAYSTCPEKAAQEGVAESLMVSELAWEYRHAFTGTSTFIFDRYETTPIVNTAENSVIHLNSTAVKYLSDGSCTDPYLAGHGLVQLMYELLMNRHCNFGSTCSRSLIDQSGGIDVIRRKARKGLTLAMKSQGYEDGPSPSLPHETHKYLFLKGNRLNFCMTYAET